MHPRILALTNFKGLEELQATFARQITVLVGANGVGKSSVLQALHILGRISNPMRSQFQDVVYDAVGGRDAVRDWIRAGGSRLVIDYRITSKKGVHLELSIPEGGYPDFKLIATDEVSERPTLLGGLSPRPVTSANSASDETQRVIDCFAPVKSILLRPELSQMTEAVTAPMGTPVLTELGGGLAAVLGWMALASRKQFSELIRLLKEVVPAVEDVVVEPVPIPRHSAGRVDVEPGQGFYVVFDGRRVPARHVSEGTVITLCLLAAVLGPQGAKVILIDDLDRGLHPRAQASLVSCIRQTLVSLPEVQLVCTSHSPVILEHFEADEVRVMWRNQGRVSCEALSSHPDWERYKGILPPGSFWSSVGDEWAQK